MFKRNKRCWKISWLRCLFFFCLVPSMRLPLIPSDMGSCRESPSVIASGKQTKKNCSGCQRQSPNGSCTFFGEAVENVRFFWYTFLRNQRKGRKECQRPPYSHCQMG